MEYIPGADAAANAIQEVFGADESIARGIGAVYIIMVTLFLISMLSLLLMDYFEPSSGTADSGSASGSVEETAETGTPTVVLTGPALSGKTALFHRLCTGNIPKTVTSLESASASATIRALVEGSEDLVDARIVDMPGHPRAAGRDRLHGLLRSKSTGLVVVVVDASTKASIRGGAGILAQMLTSASFVDSKTRVAIVGTRGDVTGCADAEGVQRMVEAELDNIRRSESALAGADAASEVDTEAKSDKLALGGMTGEPFSLKRDSPLSSAIRFAIISNTDEAGPLAGQKAVKSAIVSALNGHWD